VFNRISRRRIVAIVVAAAVVAALGGAVALRAAHRAADAAREKAAAAAVALDFSAADVTHVASAPIARWLQVSGSLEPVHQAVVKAKVTGDVAAFTLREGDAVRAGQLLMRIDSPDLSARLADREGALASARAQLALATKTRAMNLRLLTDKFISQNAFDNAESSFDVARGNLRSAEAQVQLARNALRDAEVFAPLAGIVAKRSVDPGEKVAVEAPLLTIVDLSDLEVQAIVPALDVPALAAGMPVEWTVDGFGERRFEGRIDRINPSTEPGTRAIVVHVELPNPDASLRAGMFAVGRIALAAAAAVPTLPIAAVRSDAGQDYVWTIEDGRLARRVVVLGARDDAAGRVEIRTALPAQVPVLAMRFDNLKDGAAARLVDGASALDAASMRRPHAG
jgi:RND family efflux transporter MFP subunit